MQAKRLGMTSLVLAIVLGCSACAAPPATVRGGAPPVAGILLETGTGAPEIALRASAGRVGTAAEGPTEPLQRGGAAVEAAAHRALLDLRQGGDGALVPPAKPLPIEVLRRDLERLREHVAAAWQFDADVAGAAFMRVRLRATIAPDGKVRAIEFLDSQGKAQEALMRFVEDAISTLDGSSPLPIVDPAQQTRALVFRFETGAAPE